MIDALTNDAKSWEKGYKGCPHPLCPFWTPDNSVSNCDFDGDESHWDDAHCSQDEYESPYPTLYDEPYLMVHGQ